jgi:replication fork protection complex subunit Tof1/Swi1
LFVTKWFLEFFLASRAKASAAASSLDVNAAKRDGEAEKWEFGLIAEVIERGWIVWVLKRMREAVEEKVRVCAFLSYNIS